MLDVPLWSQDRPFRNDSNVDIVRSTTLTSGYGQATSVSAAVQKTIRNPRLALPLVRSALSQRALGPLNANRRPGAVALFHIGRCGSTVLTELLDQHPKMYWDGETYGRVLDELKDAGQDRSTSGFDPATYVEQRLQRSGSRWFGYDVKFFHVTDFNVTVDDYVNQITSRGITHLVVLRRRNYLRKVVSTEIGQLRGWYHKRDGLAVERIRLNFSAKDLSRLLGQFEQWDREYAILDGVSAAHPVLQIDYETHIENDPRVAYKMVSDFLGLAPFETQVTLRRANPEPLSDLVENLDEVEAVLRGTSYAWMTTSDAP